jgi:myo-inositol-1(or 4)-monophosphatase
MTASGARLAGFETVACEAARAGGEVLRRRFAAGTVRAELKGLHDWVTEADREAERATLARISERFPEHTILSEEASPDAAAAPYRWVVDPLDGTTNFIHGVPTFGVSVALEDPEGLAAGAIYDPLRDELFHGHRGGGARMNGDPIRCSNPAGTHEALIATGFPFRELDRLAEYLTAFESFVRSTAGLRRAGAASIDLAYTACGRYDGFWEVGLSRWDLAAGVLLVREAGGTVSDLFGGDTMLESGDIVCAGPQLYAKMLEVTRKAFGQA